MRLGDRIRQIRDELGLTQGQLASGSSVSQGYLSQLENGEVKSPSAAVLLRVYPTVRMLRQIYQDYESTVDAGLLRYLANLPRDRQRRLLLILRGMEQVLNGAPPTGNGSDWATPEASPLTVRTPPPATVLKGAGSPPELTRARR